MSIEAARYYTTRAILWGIALGGLAAASVLALTPSAYAPPPLTRYDLQQSPFTDTMQIKSPNPVQDTDKPIDWNSFAALLGDALS